jgi:hypothetical protein
MKIFELIGLGPVSIDAGEKKIDCLAKGFQGAEGQGDVS